MLLPTRAPAPAGRDGRARARRRRMGRAAVRAEHRRQRRRSRGRAIGTRPQIIQIPVRRALQVTDREPYDFVMAAQAGSARTEGGEPVGTVETADRAPSSFEYRSRLKVFGLPLVHVVRGIDPSSGRRPPPSASSPSARSRSASSRSVRSPSARSASARRRSGSAGASASSRSACSRPVRSPPGCWARRASSRSRRTRSGWSPTRACSSPPAG